MDPADELAELRAAREAGDQERIARVLERYRDRLRRIIRFRLDRRLGQRIDASDVLQEAYVEAAGRIDDYLRDPSHPFFLWLRFLTAQKLLQLRRFHVETKRRAAQREVPIAQGGFPEASSILIADHLVARDTTPIGAASREEKKAILLEALDAMNPTDREILGLRCFEELNNAEAAEVLGLTESTASTRFVRALGRLREALQKRFGASDLL